MPDADTDQSARISLCSAGGEVGFGVISSQVAPAGEPERLAKACASDLFLASSIQGSLQPDLSPIARAGLSEWLAGFRAAAELVSQGFSEVLLEDGPASEEWRSLQAPRSVNFGRGANAFRLAWRSQSSRTLPKYPSRFPHHPPVSGGGTETVAEPGVASRAASGEAA